VNDLKSRKDRLYYQLSLREDLATLIHTGLERTGMSQEELAEASGKKESYISRLANAGTNCKLAAIAQVLIPIGIEPIIVEKAEWDRLMTIAEKNDRKSHTHEQQIANHGFTLSSLATTNITHTTAFDVGGRLGERLKTIEDGARGASGSSDSLGGPFAFVGTKGSCHRFAGSHRLVVHSTAHGWV
jgi:predicted XRE-type DNA-binding protein